jgi:hypothetical protein
MRANRLLLVLFLCLPATTGAFGQTVSLEPRPAVALGTQIEGRANNFGVCGPFELDRRGIGRVADPARPGELLVGFDNTVIRGASCHRHLGTIFTGAFRFDLSDLRATPITNATLNVFSRATGTLPRTSQRNFGETCLMLLEIATRSSREGEFFRNDVTGDIPSVRFPDGVRTVFLASSFLPRSTSVDITRLAQRWALRLQSNHGLVFKVRDRSIIRQNENTDSCTSYVSVSLYLTVWRGP